MLCFHPKISVCFRLSEEHCKIMVLMTAALRAAKMAATVQQAAPGAAQGAVRRVIQIREMAAVPAMMEV
jgi:hypothetical protein